MTRDTASRSESRLRRPPTGDAPRASFVVNVRAGGAERPGSLRLPGPLLLTTRSASATSATFLLAAPDATQARTIAQCTARDAGIEAEVIVLPLRVTSVLMA